MSNIFATPVTPNRITIQPAAMQNVLAPYGIPLNGLVALYDPWRDTYGKNIMPVGSEDFETGWYSYDGSTATITQNQSIAEWGTDKATRITCTAGNSDATTKRYLPTQLTSIPGCKYPVSLYIKNVGNTRMRVFNNINSTGKAMESGEAKKIILNPDADRTSPVQIALLSNKTTDGFDIIAYQPQINLGQLYPYALPSGLPQSLTDYTGRGNNAQLGSTAGADTNDPKFNGVALVGDGVDDYAVVPLASAAYRISVVDSGSGYTVVDEVPAYLNLFQTGASTYLNGKIGPTAYYNRVLTAGEIAQAKAGLKQYMASKGVTVS